MMAVRRPEPRLLESLGILRDRAIVEDRLAITVENAVFSQSDRPAQTRRALVVGDVNLSHATGNSASFARRAFPVEPYPVDWRTRGAEDMMRPFAVVSDGLQRSDTAVHEWVGLLVYWVTERSSELFPGPTQDAL
jgi:uncharacterized SAM-binding protein YcdF (DUF218 family)